MISLVIPSRQYSYFGIVVDRFDSTAQPCHIIINFIDTTTIVGLDPVALSVPLVSCHGSCISPCGQPGAFKCNPEAIAGFKVIWSTYLLLKHCLWVMITFFTSRMHSYDYINMVIVLVVSCLLLWFPEHGYCYDVWSFLWRNNCVSITIIGGRFHHHHLLLFCATSLYRLLLDSVAFDQTL